MRLRVAWALLLAVACGSDGESADGDDSTTSTSSTSTDTSGSEETASPDGSTGEQSCPGQVDEDGVCEGCDPYMQNCPGDDRCVPWANDGGNVFNWTRCSPVDPNPAGDGEPCMVTDHIASGFDNCDRGLLCFHAFPDTLEGVCAPLCTGSPGEPMCPEAHGCGISLGGVLPVCYPHCDPVPADDCPFGKCLPLADFFGCTIGPADSPAAEPCGGFGSCEPGAVCVQSNFTGGCGGVPTPACCTRYCDLDAADPDAPCIDAQVCTPWYIPPEDAPPEWTHVGLCVLPQ